MSKFIPVERLFTKWEQDPEFRKEYDPLEKELAQAHKDIEQRKKDSIESKKSIKK